jgi:hypothetical protein
MSRRIGVPCDRNAPHTSAAVSAWASKWTTPTERGRCSPATADTEGSVME